MAYDEHLADRVREIFERPEEIREIKMFGGLAFMHREHMCCGIIGEDLMVRVGPERMDELLDRPHAKAMDFTGRQMKGFILVDPAGTKDDGDLEEWVARGVAFAESLPPKAKKR